MGKDKKKTEEVYCMQVVNESERAVWAWREINKQSSFTCHQQLLS